MSKIFTKNWIGEERRSRDGYIFDFWIKLSKWLKRKVDIGRKISNCISILVKGWNIEMKWFKIDRLTLNILWRKKLGDTDEDKNWWDRENQSHYREVLRWEIYMEQELRFGLDLGRLAVLKKGSGPIMGNFWAFFFFIFSGEKNIKIF